MQIYSYLCPNEVRRFQLFSKRIFNFTSRMVQTWKAFVGRGFRAIRTWTEYLLEYLDQPLYEDSVKCPRCNTWVRRYYQSRHRQSMACHDGHMQQIQQWALAAPQLNNPWWKSQECQFLKYNSNKTSRIFISRIYNQEYLNNCWAQN